MLNDVHAYEKETIEMKAGSDEKTNVFGVGHISSKYE